MHSPPYISSSGAHSTIDNIIDEPLLEVLMELRETPHGSSCPSSCKEVQYPCTRVYSVQKPVKQCISYLCVTSVRRVYMVNKEICTKIMCKEDEIIQDEKCRQLAGLPPRRQPELQEPAEGAPDEN
ncbi:microfibrillar-associated protein 5 isoform X3 [Hyla sarda]|uniref:microfibrillar-associated protein 5 isoform X3 n=1 Tax=Hyla sarda TaxID=327740 RepID=UPI0024C3B1DE|nr:microfibrillar-associated protein 5 isoform X3 [Hyla sarda]